MDLRVFRIFRVFMAAIASRKLLKVARIRFAERHTLLAYGTAVQVFESNLSPLQIQVLQLLGIPIAQYHADH